MADLLIVNPVASKVTPERTRAVAGAVGVDPVFTEGAGHATELARDAPEGGRVFVFSGDGGFNEVLNGLAEDVPVGFVPGGGTSVLPRALGLPRDPVEAARALAASSHVRRISLGRANGRRFAFSAGVGLDAEAVRLVDAKGRSAGSRPGDSAFALAFARLLLGGRRGPVLEVEGLGRAAWVLVANCDPYTYVGRLAMHVAPQARFELGLDVVAPRSVGVASVPRFGWFALRGRGQERAADVVYGHDLDRLLVRSGAPAALQVDGEDLGDVTEVAFEAERDAVAVVVP